MTYKGIDELIGNTPMLELCNIEKALGVSGEIYAKLERFNPAGSAKDRVALQMIRDAESERRLREGGTIIEPTSGNTGIGIAAIAAAKGYKAIIVMPDTMSEERRKLIAAYGAELVLTPGVEGMKGAIAKAEEIKANTPGSIIAGQFTNPSNPKAHTLSTGPEIWEDMNGDVDYFICGVGTGGTITGVGQFLKERNPNIKIVAVEPENSQLLAGKEAGPHDLQGIGANFVPEILDTTIYDMIVPVSDQDAYNCGRLMAEKEGILVGITSGAALWTAIQIASDEMNKDKKIVAFMPDTGDRYLSTKMF